MLTSAVMGSWSLKVTVRPLSAAPAREPAATANNQKPRSHPLTAAPGLRNNLVRSGNRETGGTGAVWIRLEWLATVKSFIPLTRILETNLSPYDTFLHDIRIDKKKGFVRGEETDETRFARGWSSPLLRRELRSFLRASRPFGILFLFPVVPSSPPGLEAVRQPAQWNIGKLAFLFAPVVGFMALMPRNQLKMAGFTYPEAVGFLFVPLVQNQLPLEAYAFVAAQAAILMLGSVWFARLTVRAMIRQDEG